MSFVNSRIVKRCIDLIALSVCLILSTSAWSWEVDFSRRQLEFEKIQNQDRMTSASENPNGNPNGNSNEKPRELLSRVFESSEPSQDIVIMNTDQGFVPETLRLRKGGHYKIHVVNVRTKEKNISFILDAFSEHHNTVFGQVKSFNLAPKQDGTFSFQCPETAQQGRVVILPEERKPASQE